MPLSPLIGKEKEMYCLLTVMFGLYYSGEIHTDRRLIRGRSVEFSSPNITANELEKALHKMISEVEREIIELGYLGLKGLRVVAMSHSVSPIFSFDQLNLLKAPTVRPL